MSHIRIQINSRLEKTKIDAAKENVYNKIIPEIFLILVFILLIQCGHHLLFYLVIKNESKPFFKEQRVRFN